MGNRHLALCCALLAGGSACAMNSPASSAVSCTVQGGELLPSASGGAEALCAEIEAAAAALPAPVSVSVRVAAPHTLAATVTLQGRELPELKMSRMDKAFDRSAFQRFARTIVAAASKD